MKSDRLISCKSSPSGDSVSEQESELDSHCEPGLWTGSHTAKEKQTGEEKCINFCCIQHPAGNAAAYLSQLSLAMPSSVGSALCFKFFPLSLSRVSFGGAANAI